MKDFSMVAEELKQLKKMLDMGILTEAEFQLAKEKILSKARTSPVVQRPEVMGVSGSFPKKKSKGKAIGTGFLTVAVAGGLVVLGAKTGALDMSKLVKKDFGLQMNSEKDKVAYWTAQYSEVLNQYRDAMRNDFYKDDYKSNYASRGEFVNRLLLANANLTSYGTDEVRNSKVLYAFHDIDGNGVPELFVGIGDDTESYPGLGSRVPGLSGFTLKDGNVNVLFEQETDEVYISESGLMKIEEVNGRLGLNITTYARLAPDGGVEVQDRMAYKSEGSNLIGEELDREVSDSEFFEISHQYEKEFGGDWAEGCIALDWNELSFIELRPVGDTAYWEAQYEEVLDFYKNFMVLSDSFQQGYSISGRQISSPLMSAGKPKDHIFYAFHDIDGNGIPELFLNVGSKKSELNTSGYVAFTLEADGFSKAFEVENSFSSNDFYVFKNGVILEEYKNDAPIDGHASYGAYSYEHIERHRFYQVSDEGFELLDEVLQIKQPDGKTLYITDGYDEPEEYERIMKGYQEKFGNSLRKNVIKLDWKQLPID